MRPYGQHFLNDHNILKKIIKLSCLKPGDKVLEIGPGEGVLTEYLLDAGCHVLAVEIDGKLERNLRNRFSYSKNFELLMMDALDSKHQLSLELLQRLKDMGDYSFVSNLPYAAGTPILLNLWQSESAPLKSLLMLQKEVGCRITAKPNHSDYGGITVLMANVAESKMEAIVSPKCFTPPPNVDSCLISMKRIEQQMVDIPELQKLVKLAFSQRRKQLGKRLNEKGYELEACGIDAKKRAENLTSEQFFELVRRKLSSK